ncbi:MAG: TPM domain-containing protein [Pseudomonadota bacterium]
MEFLNKQVQARISDEINAAEKRTSGEIVAVVAPNSDDYLHVPLLWAAVVALILPLLLFQFTSLAGDTIYFLQLLCFLGVTLVLSVPFIRYRIVPRGLAHKRAHRHALDQFLSQDLHTTQNRTGVLIFVSVAERYGEIIADEGIYQKVSPEVWDQALAALLGHLKKKEVEEGFVAAIKMCADVLEEHFPISDDDEDELPNHLIILQGDDE